MLWDWLCTDTLCEQLWVGSISRNEMFCRWTESHQLTLACPCDVENRCSISNESMSDVKHNVRLLATCILLAEKQRPWEIQVSLCKFSILFAGVLRSYIYICIHKIID